MCFFITIAVPAHSAELICQQHSTRQLTISATTNPSALAAAGAGRLPLLVTGGGCSCAWYKPPAAADAQAKLARARAKYEKLGWSAAKIDRAMDAMERTPRQDEGLHHVILDLLRTIVTAHGPAAIWVHDFSGNIELEPYTISRHEQWSSSSLAESAATLCPDVIAQLQPENA